MTKPTTCGIDECNCIETGVLCYGVGRDQMLARNRTRINPMTAPTPLQIEELTAIIKSGGSATIISQDNKIQVAIASKDGLAVGSDEEFYYALEGALHELANKE